MNLGVKYNPNHNFCANTKCPTEILSLSIRVSPQIRRLTAISDIKIEPNKAAAYTTDGNLLSNNIQNIMQSLREAVTELFWDYKYNGRGIWVRRK